MIAPGSTVQGIAGQTAGSRDCPSGNELRRPELWDDHQSHHLRRGRRPDLVVLPQRHPWNPLFRRRELFASSKPESPAFGRRGCQRRNVLPSRCLAHLHILPMRGEIPRHYRALREPPGARSGKTPGARSTSGSREPRWAERARARLSRAELESAPAPVPPATDGISRPETSLDISPRG